MTPTEEDLDTLIANSVTEQLAEEERVRLDRTRELAHLARLQETHSPIQTTETTSYSSFIDDPVLRQKVLDGILARELGTPLKVTQDTASDDLVGRIGEGGIITLEHSQKLLAEYNAILTEQHSLSMQLYTSFASVDATKKNLKKLKKNLETLVEAKALTAAEATAFYGLTKRVKEGIGYKQKDFPLHVRLSSKLSKAFSQEPTEIGCFIHIAGPLLAALVGGIISIPFTRSNPPERVFFMGTAAAAYEGIAIYLTYTGKNAETNYWQKRFTQARKARQKTGTFERDFSLLRTYATRIDEKLNDPSLTYDLQRTKSSTEFMHAVEAVKAHAKHVEEYVAANKETVSKLLDAERSVAQYEAHMPEVQKLRR